MSHTLGVRQAQKQKTRQALLDAALELLEHQSLSSLGLREVTRAVGVAPTAFYRHFDSTAELGVALVEEALGSLHETITTMLTTTGSNEERLGRTVELIACLVRTHPSHVRFIARERHGGVQRVRDAIGGQLARFAEEVAEGLAADPVSMRLEPRRPADARPALRRAHGDDRVRLPGDPAGAHGRGDRRRHAAVAPRQPRQGALAGLKPACR